jgi:copper oxidase (laccase) domain-containing protein
MAARGARAETMLAAVGPSIGPDAFEVGPEVREAFAAAGLAECIRPGRAEGRWLADLPAALRVQLEASGVAAGRIEVDGSCTWSDPVAHFSYRRDGSRSGRMASIIGPI